MRRFATFHILLLATGLSACGGAPTEAREAPRGEPVKLALSLEPGAVYEGELVMTQALPTGQRVATTVDVWTEVIAAEGDVFTVEDRYETVRVTMNGEPMELPAEMKGLGDVRIQYRIDRRGRLVGQPTAEGATAKNAEFAKELVESVGEGSVPFPERPVAPGEPWEGRRDIDMPTEAGALTGTITEVHTLVRVEETDGQRWAVIDIDGDVVLDTLETDQVTLSGAGTVDGERRVLLSDGFTSEGKSEVTLDLKGQAGPKSFEITQKTGTTLRIARVDGTDESDAEGAAPRGEQP